MEEVLTIDGKQFKLTTDIPLTAEQKAQTIAEIRKQTGCGTCGQPRTAKMGQYGGVKSLPNVLTCPPTGFPGNATTPKASGDDVIMAATPTQGVAPYMITFRKTPDNSYDGSDGGATTIDVGRLAFATSGAHLPTTNPTTKNIDEGETITATYILDDTDINTATSKGIGEGSSITFASTVTDSCGAAPYHTCTNACKIFVACPTPLCDFTVT